MLAAPAAAQEGVPSGQPLALWEVLWERVEGDGAQVVLRFIAPDAASVEADDAQADMDHLCESHALPMTALPYAGAGSAVVTLMDRPVPRGRVDPDAAQLFSVYALEDGTCVPEAF